MEPPKTLKSHLSWLSRHWQQQEINKTNWEGRKRKCDWLRWGFRLSGCTQLITSPGSPNTLSSSPHDMPLILSFCLPLYLSSAWLLLSLPPLFIFSLSLRYPELSSNPKLSSKLSFSFFAFVRWFHQHLTSIKEHCNVNQVSYQVGERGFWIFLNKNKSKFHTQRGKEYLFPIARWASISFQNTFLF